MQRFLLLWTKTVQHGTKKYKRCKDNGCLQKQTERMDVGKNPLIFQLVIRIDKETKQSTETYLIRLLSSTT